MTADKEHTDSVLHLLSLVPHYLYSGSVLEALYSRKLPNTTEPQGEMSLDQQSSDKLQEELVKLYTLLLSALEFCHYDFSKSKARRKVAAVFKSSEPAEILGLLQEQHKQVMIFGDTCERISNHQSTIRSQELLQNHQSSLGDLAVRISKLSLEIGQEQRHKTLDSVSTIKYRDHHQEISRKRTKGTCGWILERQVFKRWLEGEFAVTVLYGIRMCRVSQVPRIQTRL